MHRRIAVPCSIRRSSSKRSISATTAASSAPKVRASGVWCTSSPKSAANPASNSFINCVSHAVGRDADRAIRIAALAVQPIRPCRRCSTRPSRTSSRRASRRSASHGLETRALVGGDAIDPAVVAAGGAVAGAGVLVVDPLGNVIFFHGLDQIGEALLFDLKRLLRLSNIG